MAKTFIILILLPLLSQLVRAQPSVPGLEPDSPGGASFSRPKDVIIIAVISALLFVGFYFIYLCYCLDDHSIGIGRWSSWNAWRPWNMAGSFGHSRHKASNGLDFDLVKSLPTFEYGTIKPALINKGALECAVCLTEFNDKDILRSIPKCNHVFHADCVDNWLVGYATCPICRLHLTDADILDQNLTTLHYDDTIVDFGDDKVEIMRFSRKMRNLSMTEPPRLMGMLSRSLSTGNLAARQSGNMERFGIDDKDDRRGKSDSWVYSLSPIEAVTTRSTSREGSTPATPTTTSSEEGSSLAVVPVEPTQLPV
ncbi:RING-H2 finger protein ATL11 [Beta vulgaris subsp. vulgaris]|uniref:RING-H2 finger protein ATL11 n=1 Tax=Beta vulgaris subsp. vulgaris TaxID=3555 RepID=UPI0020374E74|nr:RING-H2 finger protein ATL11 [Beta vulgaris subsp. vulgaris]